LAVDLSDLKRQLAQTEAARVRSAVRAMTDELKRTAPVDSGELARKTGVAVTAANDRQVTAVAEMDTTYAQVVREGSRPHVIRPRSRQALAFYWPKRGATVVLASVNHPGTAANPFFDRVVSDWRGYLERAR
jgi:hypothetical protein